MSSINLSNEKQRDAFVSFETTKNKSKVVYFLKDGSKPVSSRVQKATLETEYDTLLNNCRGDVTALAQSIIEGNPEIDTEKIGMSLRNTKKVFVVGDGKIAYRLKRKEAIYNPDGSLKTEREVTDTESNVSNPDCPVKMTGKLIPKSKAVRMFVFTTKYQLKHVSGLTYDFLYEIAKNLHEKKSVMLLGAEAKGNAPLILRNGSLPYRGFLEGRIDGDKYCLVLHLTNLELKSIAE